MPATYRIDTERGIVFSTAWGDLSKHDIEAFIDTLTLDPKFYIGLMQYFDLLLVERVVMSRSDIESIARCGPFGDEAKQAYLTDEDSIYGLARMFQVMREGNPDTIGVFRNEQAALRWLGVE